MITKIKCKYGITFGCNRWQSGVIFGNNSLNWVSVVLLGSVQIHPDGYALAVRHLDSNPKIIIVNYHLVNFKMKGTSFSEWLLTFM